MQTRHLGNSDPHTTPVGYGTWAIGALGGNSRGVIRMMTTPPLRSTRYRRRNGRVNNRMACLTRQGE
jgi:hypothetical protein